MSMVKNHMSKKERNELAKIIEKENELILRLGRMIRNSALIFLACVILCIWGWSGMIDPMLPNISEGVRTVVKWVALIGAIIALDEDSVIFTLVSFAWAGFGATFGPLMLFSLFWKRITRAGAVAGMLSGGIMVFVWNYLVKPLGGLFSVYELLPAFVVSCAAIVIVSLLTAAPSDAVQEDFERAKTFEC